MVLGFARLSAIIYQKVLYRTIKKLQILTTFVPHIKEKQYESYNTRSKFLETKTKNVQCCHSKRVNDVQTFGKNRHRGHFFTPSV
jgi:hypothetical protein